MLSLTRHLSRSLLLSRGYNFIKQKDIDQIKDRYPNKSAFDQVKIGVNVVKLICVQGFRDGKSDIKRWNEIRKIPDQQRTHEEERQYQEIKADMIKSLPAFIVLNVPFGGPLFFLYLQLFPTFAPTWVLTQRIYNRILKIRKDIRTIAKDFFQNKFNSSQNLAQKIAHHYRKLKESEGGNDQLRMILSILIGHYQDGTYYLTHLSPLWRLHPSLNYFLFPELSKWLLIQKIESFVNNDTIHAKQLTLLPTFEAKLQFQLHIRLDKLAKNQY